MRHRGVEPISEGDLIEALSRAPADQYVIWTGESCSAQPGSLRSRALACVHEVGVPVLLRVVLRRAARLDGDVGLDPDAVRSAVHMHQAARRAQEDRRRQGRQQQAVGRRDGLGGFGSLQVCGIHDGVIRCCDDGGKPRPDAAGHGANSVG